MTKQQFIDLVRKIADLQGVQSVEPHIINGVEPVIVVSLQQQVIDAEFEEKAA